MDEVEVLRRFNRGHTQRIGVLGESYLDTGRPLGPSRVLFEIGEGGRGVAELRAALGLDSGHLSRLIRRLEAERLVVLDRDPADGRRRVARLTAAGRREWRRLERRSQRFAERLVRPLPARLRAELAAALGTADRLLRAATAEVRAVDPASPEAGSALAQYFAELGRRFEGGFDPGPAATPDGEFLVLRIDGEVAGCGALTDLGGGTAEVKRMWIDPAWRGLGLGPRLLAALEDLARQRGRTRVVLDTNATLTEAIAMYERAGYAATGRYNDNPYAQRWFAKDLSGAGTAS